MKYVILAATAIVLGGCNASIAQSMIDHAPSCSDPNIIANLTKQATKQVKQYIEFIGEPHIEFKDVFTEKHEDYTAHCLATMVTDGTIKDPDTRQPVQKHLETDFPYTGMVSDDGNTNRVGLK